MVLMTKLMGERRGGRARGEEGEREEGRARGDRGRGGREEIGGEEGDEGKYLEQYKLLEVIEELQAKKQTGK
jgi:hypothetical protein